MTLLKRTVRDIIIGHDRFIPSTVEFKSSMLRGLTALMALSVGVVWITIDLLYNIQAYLVWYVILIVLAAAAFVLNRQQRFVLSSIVLLSMGNGLTYVFASVESIGTGIFFYFITTGFGAIVLFGFDKRWLGYTFAMISFLLALTAYLGNFEILPKVEFSEEYLKWNFVTNFSVSFLISILVIFFLVELHHDIEEYLTVSKKNLITLSDELKHSRERFKMAIEGSKAGIYEWDWAHNTIRLGSYYKKMLGYSEDDLEGMSFETFLGMLHPDDLNMVQKNVEMHFKTKEPYQTEIRLKMKDGNYKWVSDSGLSIFDDKGIPILIVGSIIDIDERKKAEQQIRLQNEMLAKANQELDRFVYSASHDMRAPLTSLLGLILIAEKTDRAEEVFQCLEMMKKRVRAMEGFIRDVTDYSRNSRLSLELKPVNIRKLVSEIVENLKFTTGAERINMDFNISPDLEVVTDMSRVKVILNNLIANAIKHHDAGKAKQHITVSAAIVSNHLSLSVEDNGLGIGPEHIDNIFNMFYRASEGSEGSGLGLYIVKETIDKLSGSVNVASSKGVGSKFTIELPLLVAEKAANVHLLK
jgi:PAS domain S-box-containing protein